jgi:hypothetical protein
VNTAAANVGCRGTVTRQLTRLMAANTLKVDSRPLVRVNDRVGFIFGSQLSAKVMDLYYAGPTGPAGVLMLTARLVASAVVKGPLVRRVTAPETVEVEIDGKRIGRFNTTALLACAIACPTLGLRATPRAGEDGGFHLVGTETAPSALAKEVPRIVAGLPLRSMALDQVAKSAVLLFQKPTRYTLDGDMFEASRIELSATRAVELVTT